MCLFKTIAANIAVDNRPSEKKGKKLKKRLTNCVSKALWSVGHVWREIIHLSNFYGGSVQTTIGLPI